MKRHSLGLVATCLLVMSGEVMDWPFAGVSGTLIPPGQTFLLGGGQDGAFKVNACNTGTVAVDILRQSKDVTSLITTLTPGNCVDQAFAFGEMAKLRNTSKSNQASLKIKINRALNSLGMRYQSDPS